ncbi:MAG: site-specific integrase [Lachnobacterium sp.]|nr:site-specific integrase [Lachnobacterium sp.]
MKIHILCAKIIGKCSNIQDFPIAQEGGNVGKSLNGKELGKGISQRTDGRYQARFTNRFGKRQTIYGKTYNEVLRALSKAKNDDEKEVNIVSKDVTLDEWFAIWMDTCKKNCRSSTKECYTIQYNRVKEQLGWRKLKKLNLIILQEAINELCSDYARKATKKVLVDMFQKAIDSDLLTKNVAKQINTVVTKEEKKERKVLTREETECFLKYAEGTYYYNLYVLALETGMRVGELCGLQWKDIDFKNNTINVNHTMCYFRKDGKYTHELHDTKTKRGKRKIPMTKTASRILKYQKLQKQKVLFSGHIAEVQYQDLVFVTKTNKPTQQFLIKQCISLVTKHIREDGKELEDFTPHTFRHTFATRAIENGMNPKTLQKILGHASLQMTMDLYCHVTDDTLYEEMQKMEQVV